MKYYIIAGEASGDLHGSNLMKELLISDKQARFRYFGGDLMQAVQNNLVKHYREMAFMGLIDVLKNLKTIKKNLDLCKSDILEFQPDVLILIDYPGFNLKVAEFAKKAGIKVFYYISPKIWAWKEWRIKKIKAFVDEMFTILPFETEFFARHNYQVHYVGNPLIGDIFNYRKNAIGEDEFRKKNSLDDRPIVALLAGSRKQEIKMVLPVMLASIKEHPNYQFLISGGPSIPESLYKTVLGELDLPVVFDQTYDLLSHSYAAIVTSGTATLETALLNVPQVVLYKMAGGDLGYKVFKFLFLKVKYAALPNLVLDEEAIKEFVMSEMKVHKVQPEVDKLLNDSNYRETIFESYSRLQKIMGEPGASRRAAQKMVELLK